MQEEQTLADPPQRGGAEFAPTGVALRDAVGQSVPHVVEGKVAEWRKAHLALAAIFRLACGLRHDVASVTPDLLEYLPPSSRRSSVRHGSGRCREAHETGKIDDVRRIIRGRNTALKGVWCQIGAVLWHSVVLATRIGLAFIGKGFVGRSLFDIISFAGEDQQRFVLRLPAESRDRSVIGAAVEFTGNTQRPGEGTICRQCRFEIAVGHVFDKAQPKYGCRNTKHDVFLGHRSGEVWLLYAAVQRITASADNEQVMHAPIRRTVRVEHETGLADRTGQRNE